MVHGDRLRLGQLLSNLVSNAVKFTPEGGQVRVRTVQHGGTCQVEVTDSGIGIPVEDRAHLFERFYRASTATGTAGSGLGLAISKAIAEAHGGTIRIADSGGTGTRFVLEIPAPHGGRGGGEPVTQVEAGRAQPLTILVADDEQDIRELVAYRLSRSGYTIVEARDGQEAFELAADQALDMAVLDVMMPRLNGFDLTERLRRVPATKQLPILLMSASVQEVDISRGFAAGADGYLTKPFTPDELLTRVQELLSRGAA